MQRCIEPKTSTSQKYVTSTQPPSTDRHVPFPLPGIREHAFINEYGKEKEREGRQVMPSGNTTSRSSRRPGLTPQLLGDHHQRQRHIHVPWKTQKKIPNPKRPSLHGRTLHSVGLPSAGRRMKICRNVLHPKPIAQLHISLSDFAGFL